jgi:fructose-1,6-bisphosphatase/inositol monophosphatase family enzyme
VYEKELTYAVEAAQTAADLLRESFASGYQDEVDEQAEQRIFELLTGVFPLYGYRGEELGLRRHPRDELKHLRLIDPHDGTAAAKDGYRGAAVSIALRAAVFLSSA